MATGNHDPGAPSIPKAAPCTTGIGTPWGRRAPTIPIFRTKRRGVRPWTPTAISAESILAATLGLTTGVPVNTSTTARGVCAQAAVYDYTEFFDNRKQLH